MKMIRSMMRSPCLPLPYGINDKDGRFLTIPTVFINGGDKLPFFCRKSITPSWVRHLLSEVAPTLSLRTVHRTVLTHKVRSRLLCENGRLRIRLSPLHGTNIKDGRFLTIPTVFINGGDKRIRTPDLMNANQALSRMSGLRTP